MSKKKGTLVTPVPYELVKCADCGGSYMRVELIQMRELNGDIHWICPKCACPHLEGTRTVVMETLENVLSEPVWVSVRITICNRCGKQLSRGPVYLPDNRISTTDSSLEA